MKYHYHLHAGVQKVRAKAALALTALGLALGSGGLALAVAGAASAAAPETPRVYRPIDCHGHQIVNVTYDLYNDADSGFHGNWATDSLRRNLKVFDEGNSTYCATVNDTGSFVTTGPNSPQNGVPLDAGIRGIIRGGYVTNVFSATLSASPAYRTHGHLGVFDATGDHPSFLSYFDNPGAISWTQPVWGWAYHTARNGNWVNASVGSFGDIANN